MKTFNENSPAPRRARARRVKSELAAPPALLSMQTVPVAGHDKCLIDWGKSVVLYLRYSTPGQDFGQSIATQGRVGREYAATMGWVVAKVFEDPAKTGGNADRPGLRSLFAYLQRNPGTIVIVALASRLARETDVYKYIKTKLAEYRAYLIVASLGDVSQDRIDEGMLESQKQRHDIAKAFRDGKIDAILDGKCTNSWPFGYYMGTDGRLWPDWGVPDSMGNADVVLRCFTEWNEGCSLGKIADGLTLEGILTPGQFRGTHPDSEWNANKVLLVLTNEIYTGKYTQAVPIFEWERFGENRLNAQKEYTIQAEWMRIVSDEVFNFRPHRDSYFGKDPRGRTYQYLLTGKVIAPGSNKALKVSNENGRFQLWNGRGHNKADAPQIRYNYLPFEREAWDILGEMVGAQAETAFSDRWKDLLRVDYDARLTKSRDDQQRIDELESLARGFAAGGVEADAKGVFADFFALMKSDIAKHARELALLKEGHTHPDTFPPFDEFYNAPRPSLQEAYGRLKDKQPFRPTDAAGLALLRIASEPFERVTLAEKPHGRFDITFHMNGKPWGRPEVKLTRTVENLMLWDSYHEREVARMQFEAAVADRSLYPTRQFMAQLGPLPELSWRMKGRVYETIHAIVLMLKFKFSRRKSSLGSGLNVNQTKGFVSYVQCNEGRAVLKRIAELLVEPIPANNHEKQSRYHRTLRDRWIHDRHPLLRYMLADKDSKTERVPDAHWDTLKAAGIACDDKSLIGRKGKNDRLAFETVMYVVRNNTRMDELAPGYIANSMMQRFLRHLDEAGVNGPLTVSLLTAQGLSDLPDSADVPPIRNRAGVFVNKRGPKQLKVQDPLRKPGGSRPGSKRAVVRITPPGL